MKVFANFISSLVLAFWLSAISIFSIQNIEPVSIKFFVWQSIQIRVGVLLTICAGIGIILGSLLPLLRPRKSKT
ncbi:MAG: LapA family protein [Xenococcus sp. (in: cyanobacteria)]